MTTYTDIILRDTANNYFIPYGLIDRLGDVDISNPTTGQNLTYDATSGKWKNTSTSATVAWGGITGTLSDQTDLNTALSGKQDSLVSGTNIKTINNTSLLGSGNIDTTEVFVAEYNITDYSDVLTAYNTGKKIFLKKGYSSLSDNYTYLLPLEKYGTIASNFTGFVFSVIEGLTKKTFTLSSSNTWDMSTIELSDNTLSNVSSISNNSAVATALNGKADNTLSNVSSIDSNSAVQTELDGKVSKSGDTMTGDLAITTASNPHFELQNTTFDSSTTTAPSAFTGIGSIFVTDTNGNYVGGMETFFNTDNTVRATFGARRVIGGNNKTAALGLIVDSSGNASCTFPNTTRVDGQYIETNETIVNSLNLNNSSSSDTGWYTLSSLPNNGKYLCWIIGRGTTGSTSGNYIYCRVVSDIVTDYMTCCATRTRTASTVTSEGVICIPVRNKRVKIKRDANWNGTGVFVLIGYRRIGTNA